MMSHKYRIGIGIVFLLWFSCSIGYATELSWQDVDSIEQVEDVLRELAEEYAQYIPLDDETFLDTLLQGHMPMELKDLWQILVGGFRQEIRWNMHILGKLIFMAICSAFLGNIQDALNGTISKIARLTILFMVACLVLESMQKVMETAQLAIGSMTDFMQAIFPIQMMLLAAFGGNVAGSTMQPSMLFLMQFVAEVSEKILFPGVQVVVVLFIVNDMSEKYKLEQFAQLIKKTILWGIGIASMLILSALSIQGIGIVSIDAKALRAVKYISGNFVPVVGDMLSGTMDAFAGGALFVKNIFGIFGLLVILFLSLYPAIKILAIYFLYKLAAAMMQPLGEKNMTELVAHAADGFSLSFAVVAMVGLLYFFSLLIIILTANFTIMLR